MNWKVISKMGTCIEFSHQVGDKVDVKGSISTVVALIYTFSGRMYKVANIHGTKIVSENEINPV
mgnify:FL=1